MTQQSNLSAAFLRIVQSINAVNSKVGTLSSLTTTDKTSLVAALNEVRAMVGAAGAAIDDAATATGTTWSSSKIQQQITAAITALINGAGGADDTLQELADKITALAQADSGLVSTAAVQSFTEAQQLQACQNIGIGDPTTNFVTAIEANLASGL